MNKADMVGAVATETGLSKTDVKKVVDTLFDRNGIITSEVSQGNKVELVGFGSFEASARAARTGRNPQTGEPIEIAATHVPKFRPGKGFKDAVAGA